ncbi:MAG: SPOR domain-containing protein [Bacteroidota bacterium]|nr:SPOR domain-containing protein [Bacteroidota bacterium]
MKTLLIALLAVLSQTLFAQMTELDVRVKLELIHNGKIDQVRAELPSLEKQYPNDAGVKYLEAYVTEDGDLAVKKYQAVVDNFPQSEWADDALYKVYQYYYAIGLYKTADQKLNQLNTQYPNSIYAKKDVSASEKIAQPILPKSDSAAVSAKSEVKKDTIVQAPAIAVERPTGKFAIQVGVYSLEAKAVQQAKQFSETVGRQATVFSKQSGGKTVYAVAFEGFSDEQSARAFGADVKTKFRIDWFLVKR